jgi:flagellar export protein FliJ
MRAGRASRLDVVLRLRRLAEERARADLALAAGGLAAASRGRVVAATRRGAEESWLAALHAGRPTGAELAEATAALEVADERVDAADRAVAAATAVIAGARERLRDARTAREVVERLRCRAIEAERLEAERREIVELAELGGRRHAWRAIEREAGA